MAGDNDDHKNVQRRRKTATSRLHFSTRLPSPAKQVIITIIIIVIIIIAVITTIQIIIIIPLTLLPLREGGGFGGASVRGRTIYQAQ